jgi:addiction module HigA family antidote
VIRTFRHRGIEKFFKTGSKAGIQPKHEARLRILLTTLNLASTPFAMNRGGWDWHPLKGDLTGHWSVSVSGNWRLTLQLRGPRRDPGGLSGLPLRASTMTMMFSPASPGELLKDFLGKRTATELANHIGVARATISRILNGRTAISVDLSIRLGEALALSPDFFSKAQLQYDLWMESRKKRQKIKPLAA